jgi:hypothetical protein
MSTLDREVRQGKTFGWLILVTDINGAPLDMTSFAGGSAGVRGGVKRFFSDANYTKAFTLSILNKTGVLAAIASGLYKLDTVGVTTLVADSVGKVYVLVTLTATETAAIPKGRYVYEIEAQDSLGFVLPVFDGEFYVSAEVPK